MRVYVSEVFKSSESLSLLLTATLSWEILYIMTILISSRYWKHTCIFFLFIHPCYLEVTRNEDKRSQKKEIEGKKYIMCNKCMLCLIYYTCVMFIMYFCKKNYCNPIIHKKMVIFKTIVKSENEVKRPTE
jgi:L-asparagine transporter-like permease